MNDPKLAVTALEDIITACAGSHLPISERCALNSGARFLLLNLEEHVKDTLDGDGYAMEKLGQVEWHIGAALGFDISNGHGAEQHRSWAFGSLSSFESRLV